MNNKKKTLRAAENKKTDALSEHETLLMLKYLFATVAMIAGIMIILTIRRRGMNTFKFYTNLKLPLEIVTGTLSIAFACVHLILKKKGKLKTEKVINFFDLFALFAIAFALFFSYGYIDIVYDTGRIISVIVLTVLFFIYSTQNMLLFTISVQSALSILGVYLLKLFAFAMLVRLLILVCVLACVSFGAYAFLKFAKGKHKSVDLTKKKRFIANTVMCVLALLSAFFAVSLLNYAVYAILGLYLAIVVIPAIEMM